MVNQYTVLMVEILKKGIHEPFSFFCNENSLHQNLFEYYKTIEPIKSLDLGCSTPVYFYCLYHNIRIQKFVGVDHASSENRLKDGIERYGYHLLKKEGIDSHYEFYKAVIKPNDRDIISQHLDQEAFDLFFTNNIIQKDIRAYLIYAIKKSLRFNFIHAANSIHFFGSDDVRMILESIKDIISPDGLIMIKVNLVKDHDNPSNKDFDYSGYKKMIIDIFKEGVIYESEVSALYLNKKKLISTYLIPI